MNQKTAFLSHSHEDAVLAEGIANLMAREGWEVYIDWKDASMPPKPNAETASKIKRRIESANFFLFLATPNSVVSRWCPWEIGYADKAKTADAVFIIPTEDDGGHVHGSEYLLLYKRIDVGDRGVGAFEPGQTSGKLMRAVG